MKLLIVSDLWVPFPGGAERFLSNIGHELAKRGHTITVLTSYPNAKDTDMTVISLSVPVRTEHEAGVALLDSEIRKVKPDLIIIHHFFAFEFQKEIVKLPLPVVQVLHNGQKIPGVKLGVFNSQYTWDHSNPSDGDMIIHPPAYADVNAGRHGEYIGFIKPIEGKGVAFFYELALRMPTHKFLVVKGEWKKFNILQEMPNVTFLDPVDDIRDFYGQCCLMLMPSLSEDAGTIPQEAAMNGLPCISSNVMGLNETNAGGIRLPLEVAQWESEIVKLTTHPAYYAEVAARQLAYLPTFQWEAKFDELSRRLNHIKFVDRYKDYNSISRQFLGLSPTQKERETFLLEHATGKILDMGCNDCGLWENYPRKANVHGIDLSECAVASARKKGFNVIVGRAEATNFVDKSFDTVAFSELIEHVENPHALLKEAQRLARVQLIGTVPRPTGGWGNKQFDPDHVQFWEQDELQALMSQYGNATVRELNADFWSFVILV